jgi:hypothetical protein
VSLRRTLSLALLIWVIWVVAWLILTYYVTQGSPQTPGRVVFAIFGPVIGIFVSLGSAFGYRELREQEDAGE